MRKVIAAINMTIDGVCDHTAGVVDEQLHQHYFNLISSAGIILYGRTTFELMKFWQNLLTNPSEQTALNDFAFSMDKIKKLVFSHALKETGWDSAELVKRPLEEELLELKKQSGKDILVGSRSLIVQLLNSHLIDELQLCVHPVIEGKGTKLFDKIEERIAFRLIKTKTLTSGATVMYYVPPKTNNEPLTSVAR